MFNFLFSLSLCVNTKYPIERESCGVNINGSYFDLSKLEKRKADSFFDNITKLTMYSRMCGGFSKEDLPFSFESYGLYSLAICNSSSKSCQPLINRFSQDYRPLKDSNFSEGVIVEFKGEPINILSKFVKWDLEFSILCDVNQADSSIVIKPEIDRVDQILKYNFGYKGACPISVPTPSPTPAFEYMCQHVARIPTDPSKGIKIDLNDMNSGPGGIMFPMKNVDETNYIFYQPCERIYCPGINCDNNYSSLWLCDPTVTNCYDYGVVGREQEIDTDPTNLSKPIVISIQDHTDRLSSQIHASCDQWYFNNHFEFDHYEFINNFIKIFVKTHQACIKEIPPPIPDNPYHCYFESTQDDVTIKFNASDLDVSGGRVLTVKTTGMLSPTERTMYFQPCSGLFCPPNADCDNYEDAYIWLCKGVFQGRADEQRCYAYGLFEKNISLSQATSTLSDGVRITYSGNENFTAEVDFLCDYSLDYGQLKMPSIVTTMHSGQSMKMEIMSRDACPRGTPKPTPHPFYPDRPTKGKTPTPTPEAIPNPMLTMHNESHYVVVNLSSMSQTIRDSQIILTSQGLYRNIQVYMTPFEQVPCPPGFDCGEFSKSTIWSCWIDKSSNPVCFPIGDSPEGTSIRNIDSTSFDRGSFIEFKGHYGINTELRVSCNPQQKQSDYFPLDTYATYQVWVNTEYIFNTSSELACPRKFTESVIPKYTPSPVPDPNAESANEVYLTQSFVVDSKQIDIDMTKIDNLFHEVIIGEIDQYERAAILFAPAKRKMCSASFSCGEYEMANVWKCLYKQRVCFPIGDIRYGLKVSLVDDKQVMRGIRATFSGGLGGYQTSVIFLCNFSLDSSNFTMDNVVRTFSKSGNIELFIRTGMVCPHEIEFHRNSLTYGSIFLIICSILFVSYFTLGVTMNLLTEGQIALPNERLWIEFALCVKTSVIFIGSCGKKKVIDEDYEKV